MKKYWLWFIVPFIIIGFYLFYLDNFPIKIDFDKAGKFGDSFGVLNSLFSGLAFIALVITIYLQQQDMKDTKEEIKKQNFENTFFKMIDLYNNLVKDLQLIQIQKMEWTSKRTSTIQRGSYEMVNQKYHILDKEIDIEDDRNYKGKEVIHRLIKIFLEYKNNHTGIYQDFHKEYENIIGHYFGTIYQILKFIDNSNIENKEDYSNLFRAQFAKNELELLFYHGTSDIAKNKFQPYLIKYEFFEHLSIKDIENRFIESYVDKAKEMNERIDKAFGKNLMSKEKINNI